MAGEHASLVASLGEMERELVQARLDLAVGRLENTARIRVLRKKYARVQTKMRQAEIASGLPKGSLASSARIAGVAASIEAAAEGQGEARGGFLKGIVDRLASKNE